MPIIRATCTLEARSGIPADRATNTYHFDVSATGEAILSGCADLLQNLYVDGFEEYAGIVTWMSDELCGDVMGIQLYNLDDPEPRAPIYQRGLEINPTDTSGLPAEVSLVVSFQGPQESGEPQARRRGRIYVPWMAENWNTESRPTTALIEGMTNQFTEFLAASDASVSVDWVVWSPTAEAAYGVDNGWVDNAWDTQRRRGTRPTARTFWP